MENPQKSKEFLAREKSKEFQKRKERKIREVSHKRVFALLTPEIRGWKMASMLQKPVFAFPGCQRTSVNTLLCDTLGLADLTLSCLFLHMRSRTIIARYVAKWGGIAQMCLCETKCQGGGSIAPFWETANLP